TRPLVLGALRHGGRGATDHPAVHRGRHLLVAGQTAMAMVLLVGAGLWARSFVRMANSALGFDPRSTLTAQIAVPPTTYRSGAEVMQFEQRLPPALHALSPVDAAGAAARLCI